ncbi:cell division protein ZapB [Halomonas dongshanensis]|uniref:Cell division protein ZapB n=1 Tax=Halomonas dongshanensis TaxID=2890835 RepID=A0ABT2EGW1_9GAMM|nr:cell division protein ZapB [Halomonas dongshanensis]MCS2610843.1 cell division protein ZapB [Halomonas dongshanensis]
MSLELLNQLEQKITATVEALELMKLENEELRSENATLKQERDEWVERLNRMLGQLKEGDTSTQSDSVS